MIRSTLLYALTLSSLLHCNQVLDALLPAKRPDVTNHEIIDEVELTPVVSHSDVVRGQIACVARLSAEYPH